MKKFAKKNLLIIIGIAIGATTGYLYWKFIGCSTGSCAITSNPVNSTLYGAVMGGLILSTFKNNFQLSILNFQLIKYDISGNNQQR